MTSSISSSLLVTPKSVDQLAHSIVDNIGKSLPAPKQGEGEFVERGHPPHKKDAGNQLLSYEVSNDKGDPAELKAAIEKLFTVKVRAVNTLVRKGKGRRYRGKIGSAKHGHMEPSNKRVNASVKAGIRNAVQHQLEENVHAAVVQALEEVDVHVVSTADLHLLEQLKKVQLQRSHDRIDKVFEVLLDGYDPAASTIAKVDQQNAEARVSFLKSIETYTSPQLAEINRHTAKNAAQTANRWKSKDRIFGIPFKGQNLFPSFQFVEGQPRPVVAEILAALPKHMTEWQTAFWFVSSNGALDGKPPYQCLDDREAVIGAAVQEGAL